MKVEVNNLQTVKNYAHSMGWTASYIYKMKKENKINNDAIVLIDGIKFIDTTKVLKK